MRPPVIPTCGTPHPHESEEVLWLIPYEFCHMKWKSWDWQLVRFFGTNAMRLKTFSSVVGHSLRASLI